MVAARNGRYVLTALKIPWPQGRVGSIPAPGTSLRSRCRRRLSAVALAKADCRCVDESYGWQANNLPEALRETRIELTLIASVVNHFDLASSSERIDLILLSAVTPKASVQFSLEP